MSHGSAYEEVSAELDRLAEALTDLAMDTLRQSLGEDSEEAAAKATQTTKLLNRARSAVVKASMLVNRAAGGAADGAALGWDEDA